MKAPETPLPAGLRMIALYRAERIKQRSAACSARRAVRDPIAPTDPDAVTADLPASNTANGIAEPLPGGSVFATLINRAVVDPPTPDHPEEVGPPFAQSREQRQDSEEESQIADVQAYAYDPPLAQIGFGSGMLIRLSQLGFRTMADLAQADPQQLRVELGEISRLVDVEAWICHARQNSTCRS